MCIRDSCTGERCAFASQRATSPPRYKSRLPLESRGVPSSSVDVTISRGVPSSSVGVAPAPTSETTGGSVDMLVEKCWQQRQVRVYHPRSCQTFCPLSARKAGELSHQPLRARRSCRVQGPQMRCTRFERRRSVATGTWWLTVTKLRNATVRSHTLPHHRRLRPRAERRRRLQHSRENNGTGGHSWVHVPTAKENPLRPRRWRQRRRRGGREHRRAGSSSSGLQSF